MVLQANQNLWIFVFLRMYSPCDVKAKVRLLILEQLWSSKTKSSQIVDTYKHLIFRELSLSPYLCVLPGKNHGTEKSGYRSLKKTTIVAYWSFLVLNRVRGTSSTYFLKASRRTRLNRRNSPDPDPESTWRSQTVSVRALRTITLGWRTIATNGRDKFVFVKERCFIS